MLSIMLDGFIVGLLLQVAIGPVFVFILNISMQKTVLDGWFAVAAVTLVDYLYIALAILGVGKLLEKPRVKTVLGILSSLVLVLFGAMMILSATKTAVNASSDAVVTSTYLASFLSAFLLTISSPLTIVFWTSLFATKAIEKGYSKKELVPFGFAAGLATLVFLCLSVTLLSLIKASIPMIVIRILNVIVGALLITYGIIRLVKTYRQERVQIDGTQSVEVD
jgi:threonine/homoserine/homoserine lactone efflux protein